jgi:ABC-type antimicrobial peptide transport system permease subunit
MHDIDPALPVLDLRTMDAVKQEALNQRRHATGMAVAFGAAGLVLALCGVYALVSFVVARERRDMGVRLALGASGGQVVWQVVGRLLRLGLAGIAAGLLVAGLTAPRLIDALGARPFGFWLAGGLVALALVVAVSVAAWLPARRVLGIDPVRALAD